MSRGRADLATIHDSVSVAQLRTLSILAGGAVGALARAGLAKAIPHGPGAWPWATFAVNVAGVVVLAWLTTRLSEMVAPTRYPKGSPEHDADRRRDHGSEKDRWASGVTPYAEMGYYDADYEPKDSDILCAYRITLHPVSMQSRRLPRSPASHRPRPGPWSGLTG